MAFVEHVCLHSFFGMFLVAAVEARVVRFDDEGEICDESVHVSCQVIGVGDGEAVCLVHVIEVVLKILEAQIAEETVRVVLICVVDCRIDFEA